VSVVAILATLSLLGGDIGYAVHAQKWSDPVKCNEHIVLNRESLEAEVRRYARNVYGKDARHIHFQCASEQEIKGYTDAGT